ncbi:hypothetical protein ACIOHO_22910 [Streptomyces sp. NPDC087849]|uniref:hypothetical protein n=1 Tax=Streptomyces sp. NPDC087849 TaxID=3365808 RepID=UPI003824EFE1
MKKSAADVADNIPVNWLLEYLYEPTRAPVRAESVRAGAPTLRRAFPPLLAAYGQEPSATELLKLRWHVLKV